MSLLFIRMNHVNVLGTKQLYTHAHILTLYIINSQLKLCAY